MRIGVPPDSHNIRAPQFLDALHDWAILGMELGSLLAAPRQATVRMRRSLNLAWSARLCLTFSLT